MPDVVFKLYEKLSEYWRITPLGGAKHANFLKIGKFERPSLTQGTTQGYEIFTFARPYIGRMPGSNSEFPIDRSRYRYSFTIILIIGLLLGHPAYCTVWLRQSPCFERICYLCFIAYTCNKPVITVGPLFLSVLRPALLCKIIVKINLIQFTKLLAECDLVFQVVRKAIKRSMVRFSSAAALLIKASEQIVIKGTEQENASCSNFAYWCTRQSTTSYHVILTKCTSQLRQFPTFLLSVLLLVAISLYPEQGYNSATGHFVWLVRSPGTVYHWTFVRHRHYQRSKTCSRHICSLVPTSLTNCFQSTSSEHCTAPL